MQQPNRLQYTVFIKNSAPPHIHRSVKQVLRQTFTDKMVISRGYPTVWLPRSPDSTPFNFWIWGFIKYQVYQEEPTKLKHGFFSSAGLEVENIN
ncbi:hypothetical protein AVEN_21654-1 [Araneus ventricosus]|uniref:Uncharacterized protein n=1 Tax=Araneus ventricosus TaxID=182803 RepID=A0A4Y2VL88_ARAVE|nr:hypothetical protein AVEN_21654-1 [Araneus ventricosus]